MSKKTETLDEVLEAIDKAGHDLWLNAGDIRSGYDEDLPCFSDRIHADDQIPKEFIPRVLTAAVKEPHARGVVVFSVNEKEINFKEWLKAAMTFKGATITVGRSRNHGDYKCFFVCIPCESRYTSYEKYIK